MLAYYGLQSRGSLPRAIAGHGSWRWLNYKIVGIADNNNPNFYLLDSEYKH